MTYRSLCSLVAKYEGKKHQASVGDIREIISILAEIESDYLHTNDGPVVVILTLARKKLKRRAKKVKAKK